MNNNQKIFLSSGITIGLMLLAVVGFVLKNTSSVVKWGVSYDQWGDIFPGLPPSVLTVFILICIIASAVAYLITKNNTARNVLITFVLTFGHCIFLFKFYYGYLYEMMIQKYGYDHQVILLGLTASLIPVVVIIYHLVFSHFETKPRIWVGYAVMDIIGSIWIAVWIYNQPVQLFVHQPTTKDGKAAIQNGQYEVRNRYWILRSGDLDYDLDKVRTRKANVIIDISSSAGISGVYGKQYKAVTPNDVKDMLAYRKANPKIPLLSNRIAETVKTQGKADADIIVFAKSTAFDVEVITEGHWRITSKNDEPNLIATHFPPNKTFYINAKGVEKLKAKGKMKKVIYINGGSRPGLNPLYLDSTLRRPVPSSLIIKSKKGAIIDIMLSS